MLKKYTVSLTVEQERKLREILDRGRPGSQKRKRAQALLMSHEGQSDRAIADLVGMHVHGLEALRRRFVEEGFERTLHGAPRPQAPRLMDRAEEARLMALAREQSAEGSPPWSLRRLRDKFVTLEGRTVSHETIRQVLKRAESSRPRGKRAGGTPEHFSS